MRTSALAITFGPMKTLPPNVRANPDGSFSMCAPPQNCCPVATPNADGGWSLADDHGGKAQLTGVEAVAFARLVLAEHGE